MWLDEFFFELATYAFFIRTAYKFRPGSDNPYLQVPSDDEDDIDMDEVWVKYHCTFLVEFCLLETNLVYAKAPLSVCVTVHKVFN